MRTLTTLFCALIVTQFSYAQISFLDSNYTAQYFSHREIDGSVEYATADNLYMVQYYSPTKKDFRIIKYGRDSLDMVWAVDFVIELERDGVEYKSKSILVEEDGTVRIFRKGYDEKGQNYKIYLQSVTSTGEKSDLVHLLDIPDSSGSAYTPMATIQAGKGLFISFITNFKESGKIHGIWVNHDAEAEKHISIPVNYEEAKVEKLLYNKRDESVYAMTLANQKGFGDLAPQPGKGLYRFKPGDEKAESISLQFEEFRTFENQIDLDTIANKLLYVCLAGPKTGNSMNATAIVKIGLDDWKIESLSINPLSERAVKEVTRSGKVYGSAKKNSPKVEFKKPTFWFCPDGTYYVVFSNGTYAELMSYYRYGDYVLKFDKNDKLLWDNYVSVLGFGRNQFSVVNNELVVSTLSIGKWLKLLYPENASFAGLSKMDEVLLHMTLNDFTPQFKTIMIVDSEAWPSHGFSIEEFATPEYPLQTIISFFPHKWKFKEIMYMNISPK